MNKTIGESSSASVVSRGGPMPKHLNCYIPLKDRVQGPPPLHLCLSQQVGMNVGSRGALLYLSVSKVYEDTGGRCIEASACQLRASRLADFIQCSIELISATTSL